MNTELQTWKQRQTKWIENGYKPEGEIPKAEFVNPEGSIFIEHHHKTGYTSEPTIKVSDLREWCEARIAEWEPVEGHPNFAHKPEGIINEMNWILDQFCKEAK